MEAAIPLCHVVEKFDEAFNTVGYIVASAENGFPVFASAQADREHQAASNQPNMVKYAEDSDNQWVNIKAIHVSTEYDKAQLLMALEYLHDCYIDTDFIAVNALVHLYQNPDKIVVDCPS
jgi:hypothetical protein